MGVPHSCDNRYQFGTLDGSWRPYTGEDWELSLTMRKFWANFARTGDPNGAGLPQWDTFDASRRVMRLSAGNCAMTDYNWNRELLDTERQIEAKYSREIPAE